MRATAQRVMALAGVSLLLSCGAPPPPDPGPPATMPSTPGALSLNRVVRVHAVDSSNGGRRPRYADGVLTVGVPANAAVAPYHRSAVEWADGIGDAVRLSEGDDVAIEFTIRPRLGAAATDPNLWAVFWQLDGPLNDDRWPSSPLALSVSRGTWKLGGGAGHPEGNREEFAPTVMPYRDGEETRWRFDLHISPDPAQARVTVWLNGERVVDSWRPRGGTSYPGQRWLAVKNGLTVGASTGMVSSADRSAVFTSVALDKG